MYSVFANKYGIASSFCFHMFAICLLFPEVCSVRELFRQVLFAYCLCRIHFVHSIELRMHANDTLHCAQYRVKTSKTEAFLGNWDSRILLIIFKYCVRTTKHGHCQNSRNLLFTLTEKTKQNKTKMEFHSEVNKV